MNYSKATNYALHTMQILAKQDHLKRIGVTELAQKQDLSPTYLSKILTKLAKAGLIDSSIGVGGGYILAKKPEVISFLEIIQAIEGRTPLFRGCEAGYNHECKIDEIMDNYEQHMIDYLSQKNLRDVM